MLHFLSLFSKLVPTSGCTERKYMWFTGKQIEKKACDVSHQYLKGVVWHMAYYVCGSVPVHLRHGHDHPLALWRAGNCGSPAGASWDWCYPLPFSPSEVVSV